MTNTRRISNAPSWWERSIVARSTHAIQNMVDTMMEDATFLQQHEDSEESNTLPLQRGNVQIGAMLGKGSFSVVSEVTGIFHDRSAKESLDQGILHDLAQQGRFAIKHLRPDLIKKPDYFQAAAADLILEAKYLAALNHPGILKLRAVAHGGVSAYETSGGLYDGFFMITDRLHCTLRDKILEWQCLQQEESLLECLPPGMASSPIEETKDELSACALPLSERLLLGKLDILRQVASALQYLHDRRLICRDLKPANVGMTADNQVKLFDFGFCRELPSWGGVGFEEKGEPEDDDALYYMSGKGSMMYLAPEVLQNGRCNRKADCYSFAMLTYEVLTLNKPFHSVPNLEAFRVMLCKHQARPPLEYSDIPLSLQDLLCHSWDNTVRDRWTMRQISERLQEISQEFDASPVVEKEEVIEDHPVSHPVACGVILDLIKEFAHDVQLGYHVLTGNAKVMELQHQKDSFMPSGPLETAPLCDEAELRTASTAVTEASSVFTGDEADTERSTAYGSLYVTSKTATEEPLEVTLEEAMSMSTWYAYDDERHEDPYDSDCEHQSHNQSQDDTRQGHDADELRCPPSPPLVRTNSDPMQRRLSLNLPVSPHYPNRRQSMGSGKLFLLPENNNDTDLSPPFPQRRQSTGGAGFVFPESHWLPSAVELQG